MNDKYSDIINLKRPKSKNHIKMPIINRAAQFAPFAALTGHAASIREASRLTHEKIELSEDELELLNRKIVLAISNPEQKVEIVYFLKDQKKMGGEYIVIDGNIKKYNEIDEMILMKNGIQILISDIYDVKLIN